MAEKSNASERTHTSVIIGGKRYNVVSYEESEYIEGLAGHINDKIDKVMESGNNILGEKPLVLAALNICDEYFKVYSAGMDMQKEIAEISDERDKANAKLAAMPENAEDAANLKGRLDECAAELDKTKSALLVLEGSLKNSEQKLKEQTELANVAKKEKAQTEERLTKALAEVEDYKTRTEKIRTAKSKAAAEMTSMTARLKSLEDERERLNKRVNTQKSEIDKLKANSQNTAEADSLRQQVVQYSKDLTKADSRVKTLEADMKKRETELSKKLNEQKADYERRIAELEESYKKQIQDLNNEFLEMIDKS